MLTPSWVEVAAENPKKTPKIPKFSKTYRESMILAFSPFRARSAPETTRWPKGGANESSKRRAKDDPNNGPQTAQEASKMPQEASKSTPKRGGQT